MQLGPLGVGRGGAHQQASLAWFTDMLDGVWGCLDLRKASAVVEWLESDTLCKQPVGFGYQILLNTSKSCMLVSQAALTISAAVPKVYGVCLEQRASGSYTYA